MAEYPSRPVGAIEPSWFGLDITTGEDAEFCMYAIVPYIVQPTAWCDVSDGQNSTRLTVSRAISVPVDTYYLDNFQWRQYDWSLGDKLILAADPTAYTNMTGWTTRQEETLSKRYTHDQVDGAEFGVIRIEAFADTAERENVFIAAYSIEYVHDTDFDDAGGSEKCLHVERIDIGATGGIVPGRFASAYHAQWCLATSINRAVYEDRHSNVWPVFDHTNVV